MHKKKELVFKPRWSGLVDRNICVCAIVLVLNIGCHAKSQESSSQVEPIQAETASSSLPFNSRANASQGELPPDSLDFAGHTWHFAGSCSYESPHQPIGMSAVSYTAKARDKRLVCLTPDKSSPWPNRAVSRILQVQVRRGAEWVDHGPRAAWYSNGDRGEYNFVNGYEHGLQRAWYSTGQLKIEREWRFGEMNGPDRGWYEDGAPMYDIVNQDGQELPGGKAWHQDGSLFD